LEPHPLEHARPPPGFDQERPNDKTDKAQSNKQRPPAWPAVCCVPGGHGLLAPFAKAFSRKAKKRPKPVLVLGC
jgi:hypothetical protein